MSTEIQEVGLASGLPSANDRILTTCFLAALLHAILILGVTFSAPPSKAGGSASAGIEVILVGDRAPSVAHNPSAKYLAERNQLGSGNTTKPERARIPKSSPLSADHAGIAAGDGLVLQRASTGTGEDALLATRGAASRIFYFSADAEAKPASETPIRLEKRPDLAMNPNDDGVELRLRGARRNELWIAADTKSSDVARYLDDWRRKVERVGTINFPRAARREMAAAKPIVEVTIDADGRLAQAVVRRSSGRPEIDDAALRILRLAAPFEPFPRAMTAKHDQIRIAYAWEFLSGSPEGASVLYSDPGSPAAGP